MNFRWTAEAVQAFENRKKQWEAEGRITTHSSGVGREAQPGNKRGGRKKGVQVLNELQRRSKLELALLAQMEAEKMETPHCEYKPLAHRKFRLDFAWPTPAIGIEVQGMVHRIKGRFKADLEKRQELLLAGWRVLEVGGDDIRSGRAIELIKRLLA